MIFRKTVPPNYEKIVNVFPFVSTNKNIVFTYGETLYIQENREEDISDHLLEHENTHTKQQGDYIEDWWERYLSDDSFRMSQEVEAYHNQYMYVKNKYGTNNAKRLLFFLARDLSSEIYRLNITFNKAEILIKKGI